MSDTIRVQVHVDRAAAILAGHATWGDQTVAIPITGLSEAERQELSLLNTCDKNDSILDTTASFYGRHGFTPPEKPAIALATEEAVHSVLAWRIKTRKAADKHDARVEAENAAERLIRQQEAVAAWLGKSYDDLIIPRYLSGGRTAYEVNELSGHLLQGAPDNLLRIYHERLANLKLLAKERTEEAEEERSRAIAAAIERDKANAARRSALNERLIQEHCSEEQQRRHRAKRLPEAEMLTAVRTAVFAPLDSFARYEKLTRSDILAASDDREHYDEEEYSADEAEAVDADTWATYETIEKVAKSAIPWPVKVDLRTHYAGWKSARDWSVERNSVRVTVTRDEATEFTVSREYAAP